MKLVIVFLRQPIYILPTIQATRDTMKTCNTLFGNDHFRSGKANAFRHAYWNFVICEKSLKTSKNELKSIKWAEKITDLYENVTKNEKLEQMMDFHNNKVGREQFLSQNHLKRQEIINFFMKMSQKATKIDETKEWISDVNQLVYIED